MFFFQGKANTVTFFKWYFVIAWTGYGVEMTNSVVSETVISTRYIDKLFISLGVLATLIFTAIPVLMALLTQDWH